MCGIVGIIAPRGERIPPETIQTMRSLIKHRGPDDSGYASIEAADGVIRGNGTPEPASLQMGFTRLSIRDLSHRAHQPMVSDDKTLALVFNGEIYNTPWLISTYLSGIPLRSTSDTEVVLRMCQVIGLSKTVKVLNGMFALALYDGNSRKLEFARDRFGIKPLYYTARNNTLAFASEIKPLLASGIVSTELDPESWGELATFRYVADPKTPFKNIHSLSPGTIATVDVDGKIRSQSYWQPNYAATPDTRYSVPENAELAEKTLKNAVHDQLVSDVQVGLELSGGVDSSLLAWSARETGLNGYSAIPSSDALSEEKQIDHVSNITGTDNHKLRLTPDTIAAAIGEVAYFHETPINHEGSIGIYLVCKLAKSQGVSVLMSGEGADELFAGYKRYQMMHDKFSKARLIANATSAITKWMPRRIQTANRIWSERDNNLMLTSAYGTPELVESIFMDVDSTNTLERRRHHMEGFDWSELDHSHLVYDQKTYMVDLLARQDKLSMAHSVETRVPFLDNSVAALAETLPMDQKLGKLGDGKFLLKQIVAKEFGYKHAYREKFGFGLPYSFMAGSQVIRDLAKSCAAGLKADGITMNTDQVFFDAVAGDGYADRLSWILLSIGMWYDIYFRNSERVSQFVDLPNNRSS